MSDAYSAGFVVVAIYQRTVAWLFSQSPAAISK